MKRRDFMAGVGASILLAVAHGNSQVTAQRPRLLIANADAFTGLALLKTRYANGMRPSDDMEGGLFRGYSRGKRVLRRRPWPRCAPATSPKG